MRQTGVFDSLTAAALMSNLPDARSHCPALSAVKKMATAWDDQDVHDKWDPVPTKTSIPQPSHNFVVSQIFPFFLLRAVNSFYIGPSSPESSSVSRFSSCFTALCCHKPVRSEQMLHFLVCNSQRCENGLKWAARLMNGQAIYACLLVISIYFYINIHTHITKAV